jgi:hypothetical protein
MLSTAWIWIRLLAVAAGVGAFWLGLTVLDNDDLPGLELISGGAGVILLCLAATFWAF